MAVMAVHGGVKGVGVHTQSLCGRRDMLRYTETVGVSMLMVKMIARLSGRSKGRPDVHGVGGGRSCSCSRGLHL